MLRRILFGFATLFAWALCCRPAGAHTVGVSRGDYLFQDGKVLIAVAFARAELGSALPWLVDREGNKSLVAFEDQREHLGRWLSGRLSVSADGTPCVSSFDAMRFDGDGVAFAFAYACRPAPARIVVDARFIADLGEAHRHLAALRAGDRVEEHVATADQSSFALVLDEAARAQSDEAGSPSRASFFALLRMGIEHILTGYDHLLFLLGLVLVGGPLRSLAAAVTAFTLSHSLTLALATFDIWAPSQRLVEPCIALSIAYVGIENWFVKNAEGRFKITFFFGLVHGFGFAAALRSIAVPHAQIPMALFGFNLGVELGQLVVVAAVLPLILFVRKKDLWTRVGMRACTAAVALGGVAWFVVRLRGLVG